MDSFCIVYEPSLEHYMVEYLESLRSVGVCARHYYSADSSRKKIYLQKVLKSDEDTYLCNTEQLTTHTWNVYTNGYIAIPSIQRLFFLDYSASNLEQIKRLSNYEAHKTKLRLYHLPYCFREAEIQQLRSPNEEKVFDVGMIGVYEPRRMMILQQLRDAGLKVNAINVYGHARDVQMRQCKVLVNVHIRDDYTIFEEIRCMRWWYAGVPVISETSSFQSVLDVEPYIVWAPLDNLAATVVEFLQGGGKALQNEEIIAKIAQGRKKTVEDTFASLAEAVTKQS